MFAKLLVIILSIALSGAVLLVQRQQRIELSHDMLKMHRDIRDREEQLWKLRAEIANQCRPAEIREMMEPLNIIWTSIPDHATDVPEPLLQQEPPVLEGEPLVERDDDADGDIDQVDGMITLAERLRAGDD